MNTAISDTNNANLVEGPVVVALARCCDEDEGMTTFVAAVPVADSAEARLLPDPALLSLAEKCEVSADTKGTCGSITVVLRDGTDPAKDRWAVSKKSGPHWIRFDWPSPVLISRVAVEFGTSLAHSYRLQIRLSAHHPWENVVQTPYSNIIRRYWGSGAKFHCIDEIDVPFSNLATSLRIFVDALDNVKRRLSIWRIEVFGYASHASIQKPVFLERLPVLLTDRSDSVRVAASHNGDSGTNIGSVLNSGTDYSKDRWAATAVNNLWVRLDFPTAVLITKVVIDWSKLPASCKVYYLQVGSDDDWHSVRRLPDDRNMEVEVTGDDTIPSTTLHMVHRIKMPLTHQPTSSLRLLVSKPATATTFFSFPVEVSLWQIRVYGYKLE